MNPAAIKLNNELKRRTVPRCLIPIKKILPLPENAMWATREYDTGYARLLMSRIQQEGKVPEHNIKLVCDWPDLVPKDPTQSIDFNMGQNPAFINQLCDHPLYAWSGNHSRGAILDFHNTYTGNILTQNVLVDVTMADLEDRKDVDLLVNLGSQANKLASTVKHQSDYDMVMKMHTYFEEDNVLSMAENKQTDAEVSDYVDFFLEQFHVLDTYKPNLHDAEYDNMSANERKKRTKEEKKKESKKDKAENSKRSTTIFMAKVARCYKEEWDQILVVCEEQMSARPDYNPTSKEKHPVSFWWYQPLLGLNRDIRLLIMDKARTKCDQNIITHANIKLVAAEHRAREKVREEIVIYYNQKRASIDIEWPPVSDFDDVLRRVPAINEPLFIETWYCEAERMTADDTFPEIFYENMHEMMLMASNSKLAKAEKEVYFITFFV